MHNNVVGYQNESKAYVAANCFQTSNLRLTACKTLL